MLQLYPDSRQLRQRYSGVILRASLRLIEQYETTVEGGSLESVHAQLAAACPEGFDLVEPPVKMGKSCGQISALGTYTRRDQTQEIQAATMRGLQAQVPEGWQMLYVVNGA